MKKRIERYLFSQGFNESHILSFEYEDDIIRIHFRYRTEPYRYIAFETIKLKPIKKKFLFFDYTIFEIIQL